MKRALIRSTLFNLLFYCSTALFCILLLPTLLLPRTAFLFIINAYLYIITALEYLVLNLKYEVRGIENLPKKGSFIIASKHQSAYETFKLRLLFKDPAIVLKKELFKIPLWGTYLKKSGVIAIDRSSPIAALKSIKEGSRRVIEQNRSIIIFPQGTRVWPHQSTKEKPYKAGVVRIQEATGLPIVPIALNSGMFWPRSGWLKSSGTVILEILKPIKPGLDKNKLMKKLEKQIEEHSEELEMEARLASIENHRLPLFWLHIIFITLLVAIAGAYTFLWYSTAHKIEKKYKAAFANVFGLTHTYSPIVISGFPGPISFQIDQQNFETDMGKTIIKDTRTSIWPIPYLPAKIKSGKITISSIQWAAPIEFEKSNISFRYDLNNTITFDRSMVFAGKFEGGFSGTLDMTQKPVPKLDLLLEMRGYQSFITSLVRKQIIKERIALFLSAGFSALAQEDGGVRVPINQKGQKIYAGPLPLFKIPDIKPAEEKPEESTSKDPLANTPFIDQNKEKTTSAPTPLLSKKTLEEMKALENSPDLAN